MITHSVGLLLRAASSIESGVAVRKIATRNLIYIIPTTKNAHPPTANNKN